MFALSVAGGNRAERRKARFPPITFGYRGGLGEQAGHNALSSFNSPIVLCQLIGQLTGRGKTQAKYAGQALAAKLICGTFGFYSSDLPRARQTAEVIGRVIDASPVWCPALRELNNGVAKDKTLAEAERLRLPVTEPILEWIPYPEAESWG